MPNRDLVVGGCILPREDLPSTVSLEGRVLAVGSHTGLGIPCLRVLLEGRSLLCAITSCPGCAEGAWGGGRETPCSFDAL